MNRRNAYSRWRRTQSRLKKRLATVAMLALAGSAALMALALVLRDPAPDQPALLAMAAPAPALLRAVSLAAPVAAPGKVRRVYPYSIIPGGVSDSGELARRLKTDKVAAAHYASFNVSDAKAVTVTQARGVYVSYRKGDKVYWTAKKLMLAKGETLLSDGTSEVRTRCGNRISDVPQLPVEAKGPTAEELDSPVEQEQEGGLQVASFSMDEIGSTPSLAGLAYQLPVLASVANMVQASYEPPSFGTFGKVASVGGVGDSPATFLDLRPVTAATSESSGTDGSGSGSTGNPPSNTDGSGTGGTGTPTDTGGSGSGSTPGTPTQPGSSTPTQPGSSTPTSPESSTPTQPGSSTPDGGGTGGDTGSQPPPGNPVAPVSPTDPSSPKPGDGTYVPPEIPDDMLSPPTFPVKPAPPAQNHGVPEPGTAWLAGAALAALVLLRRLRPRSKR